MGSVYQNRLTALYCFHDNSFCLSTRPVERVVNDYIAQTVDAVICFLRFLLCDSDKRDCRPKIEYEGAVVVKFSPTKFVCGCDVHLQNVSMLAAR